MIKIDVWDCAVRGLVTVEPDGTLHYLDDSEMLLADDNVYAAAIDAVLGQGGAIHLSGWYSASPELIEAIEQSRASRNG